MVNQVLRVKYAARSLRTLAVFTDTGKYTPETSRTSVPIVQGKHYITAYWLKLIIKQLYPDIAKHQTYFRSRSQLTIFDQDRR